MSAGDIWFVKKEHQFDCTYVCVCLCVSGCVCPCVHVSCDGLVTYLGRIPTSQPVTAGIDSSTSHHPDWEYVDGQKSLTSTRKINLYLFTLFIL